MEFFLATEEFSEAYDQLSDADAMELDKTIRRLLDDPGSAWARQGRIGIGVDDRRYDGAWIVRVPVGDTFYNVYWEYEDSETLLLIALVPAP